MNDDIFVVEDLKGHQVRNVLYCYNICFLCINKLEKILLLKALNDTASQY